MEQFSLKQALENLLIELNNLDPAKSNVSDANTLKIAAANIDEKFGLFFNLLESKKSINPLISDDLMLFAKRTKDDILNLCQFLKSDNCLKYQDLWLKAMPDIGSIESIINPKKLPNVIS